MEFPLNPARRHFPILGVDHFWHKKFNDHHTHYCIFFVSFNALHLVTGYHNYVIFFIKKHRVDN